MKKTVYYILMAIPVAVVISALVHFYSNHPFGRFFWIGGITATVAAIFLLSFEMYSLSAQLIKREAK